ncbi:MAG: hypothetical protein ACOVKO_09240 [Elstera sp.]
MIHSMSQLSLLGRPRRLIAPITEAIDAAYQGNRWLAATGFFFLLCLIPTGLAYLLDERQLNGISVWIKPMKFQASLGVHLLTVSLLLGFLQEEKRFGRMIFGLAMAMIVMSLFEAIYIAFQAAQAQASHYALGTPFQAMMYRLMGVGAVTLVVTTSWIGVLILRRPHGPKVLTTAAGLGLFLGGLLGGITGAWMAAQPGHWVGGVASDAGGLPIVGWARDGGDLRVAHFFGLHLMQALPLLALLLWAMKTQTWRVPLYTGAALGTLLTAVTFVQAISGRPFL